MMLNRIADIVKATPLGITDMAPATCPAASRCTMPAIFLAGIVCLERLRHVKVVTPEVKGSCVNLAHARCIYFSKSRDVCTTYYS
jgi:hypothetical protein